MKKRHLQKTEPGIPGYSFNNINERAVDDISLELFYKPHTITLLAVSIIGVMCFAWIR